MAFASKYTGAQIEAILDGWTAFDKDSYLPLTGGTLTGPLKLKIGDSVTINNGLNYVLGIDSEGTIKYSNKEDITVGNANDSDKLDGLDSEDFSRKHSFNVISKAIVKLMSITRTGRGGVTFNVSGVSNNNIARYYCVYGIYYNSGDNITPVLHEFVNYLDAKITAIKVSDTQYDVYLTAPSAWGNYDLSIIYAQACNIDYPKTVVSSITGDEITKSNTFISSPVSVRNSIDATGLVKSDTGFQTTGYVSVMSANYNASNV